MTKRQKDKKTVKTDRQRDSQVNVDRQRWTE